MRGYGAWAGLRKLLIAASFTGFATLNTLSPALAEPIIAALGDSLTAGYGLVDQEGLVPQLSRWLAAQDHKAVIQNAGVSGDTTAGGLARLDWALGPEVEGLILALGANDMLRGIDPAQSRANLAAILAKAKARDLPVLLVGIKATGNFGPDYKTQFDSIYPDLAAEYEAGLMPDFFAPLTALNDGTPASFRRYMQPDGLHPSAEGISVIVDALGPHVITLLAEIETE